MPALPEEAVKTRRASGVGTSELVRVPEVVRAASVSVRATVAEETVAASLVPLMVI